METSDSDTLPAPVVTPTVGEWLTTIETSVSTVSGWQLLREKFVKQEALGMALPMLVVFKKKELRNLLDLNMMELVVIYIQLHEAGKTMGFKVK
jgi:hypothetical protein